MTEQTPMTPLESRRNEVEQYEKNIALYQSILKTLPTEWPDRLLKYRNVPNQHESASEISNLADVELLSKLWYADECMKAIRAETVEMTKAKAILNYLENQK